jgi:heat shock protein HspQ
MLESKYRIGQVVSHSKQKYSGVIIDVDPSFQPRGVKAPIILKKNIAAEHPWYRILVNNTNHITYVKEPLLDTDEMTYPIFHLEEKGFINFRDVVLKNC